MTGRVSTQLPRMALRRATRGTGSHEDLYDRRTSVQPIPKLVSVLGSLRWALIEGVALRAYAPERMTLDVDIVVHEHDSRRAREAFIGAGYEIVGDSSIGGFTAREDTPDAMPVDVISRSDAWLEDALASPRFDDAGYPVLARPYLTLLKLQAGRTQDLADVLRLLASTPPDERASTRRLVATHVPDLVEDYGSLITLSDLEFGPPREEQ